MLARSTSRAIVTDRCASLGCSVCRGIDSAIKQELERLARVRRYAAGETVFGEEEEIPFVGNVVSGVLRMQKTIPDGRQQIVGLLVPSDMFGRVFSHRSQVSIEAATPVTLCCYSRRAFEALLGRFPALEHRMLLSILDELDAAQDWMMLLGCQTVMERVATFLLIVRGRSPGLSAPAPNRPTSYEIEVPINRRDMAAYLGTTAESISRSIQEMARQGVLRIADACHFEILNERQLIWLSGRGEAERRPERQLLIA
ncbi:Crp/Fnr family transcriptional regulator [Allomesorhizobium alhagi]|uniref:Crp/FNR family transcriptional regulator n=1 Tax=Mesorhizobium alhagi CCNWXJ12-2 TaxID=1107882 RepID=H0I1A1_9HYPH|nr:Crp/Fnr family transcriptional regulator [Mesorhizobium alhagi]EHK53263.1 Crp/FNR family transcriptional regulator [Mesorhizobium alhagi CCNWXJ12-2]